MMTEKKHFTNNKFLKYYFKIINYNLDMSYIFYYSKYCETSKKYLPILTKSGCQKDIHFICIDRRVKDANNKTYIILENPKWRNMYDA